MEVKETEQADKDIESFNTFSENLRLLRISLNEVEAKLNNDAEQTDIEKQVYIDKKAYYQVIDDANFRVFQDFDLSIADKNNKENSFLTIKSIFTIDFSSELPIDENIFKTLAETTVLITAWPYLRELVQSITVRMGVPPITVPPIQSQ